MSFGSFYLNHYILTPCEYPDSTMSTPASAVIAKLAELANICKQNEERCKELELEAERERLEEERLAKELEIRAEEERKAEETREAERWAEEWRKHEEEEAGATKVFAQKEAEKLRKQLEEAKRKKEVKRSRPESETEVEAELEKEEERTRESAMMDRKIVWRTKAGRIFKYFTLPHTFPQTP